jgi:hypothetical protein
MTENRVTQPLNRPDGAPSQSEALVTAEPSADTNNSLDSCDEFENYMDSEEITGFRPTREELEIIARHWAEQDFNQNLDLYVYDMGMSGSHWRNQMYWLMRLSRVAKVIGKEAVSAMYDEIEKEERNRIRERFKARFERGTEDEWEVLREEFQLDMKRRNRL